MTLPGVLSALADGAALGVRFNPLFATAGAAIAAALSGTPKAPAERRFTSGAVLLIAWLAGDGLRIVARARDAADGIGPLAGGPEGWISLATWALVGLGVGYALPALVGYAVGRRVTFGTGWLAAATIAVAASLALATVVAALPL